MEKILYGLVFTDKETKKGWLYIYHEYDEAFFAMKRQYENLESNCKFGELNDKDAWLDSKYKWEIIEFLDLNNLVIDKILDAYLVKPKTGEKLWESKEQIYMTSATKQKTDEEIEEYYKHVGHGIFDG